MSCSAEIVVEWTILWGAASHTNSQMISFLSTTWVQTLTGDASQAQSETGNWNSLRSNIQSWNVKTIPRSVAWQQVESLADGVPQVGRKKCFDLIASCPSCASLSSTEPVPSECETFLFFPNFFSRINLFTWRLMEPNIKFRVNSFC